MPLILKRKISSSVNHYTSKGKRRIKQSYPVLRRKAKNGDISSSAEAQPQVVEASSADVYDNFELRFDERPSFAKESNEEGQTRYTTLKRNRLEEWKNIREDMYRMYIHTEAPLTFSCMQCGDESPLYRCVDCTPWDILCQQCLIARHKHPHLHIFETWSSKAFVGCMLETPPWNVTSHTCDMAYSKSIVIVDDKGRQHVRLVQFCKCETEATRLVRYKLWPSSSKFPRLAFSMELLRWLNGLLMESHVSVKSFCESLKARSSKHHRGYINSQMQDIYKVLMTETVEEFRYFLYRTEHLNGLCGHLDDGTQCPACYHISPKVFSFDADFQLVRKASSGKQWDKPKHAHQFFLDQSSVDSFMEGYNADKKKPDVECSDFQAGSNIRSKSKNKKLAETAVFGSTCRHEFPKYFFSLKHGERLGYSVYLLKKLLEEETDDHPLYVMYDIACILESHLKKQSDQSWLQRVKLSIPIFHAYGHKVACQVLYGPRRTPGIGLTDGESLERLWSYLGKFSRITKETTPENRIDLLVDGLLHYSRKIRDKLGASLTGKLEKAVEVEKTSKIALQELLSPLPGISGLNVRIWLEEEKTTFTSVERSLGLIYTPQEEYSLALDNLSRCRRTLTTRQLKDDKEYKRRKKAVERLEKKLSLHWDVSDPSFTQHLSTANEKHRRTILMKLQRDTAERLFLLEMIKKYAKGQSIAIRLSKQVKKIGAKIQQSIVEYNSIGGFKTRLPLWLSFDEVKDQESTIWLFLEISDELSSEAPAAVKRHAVNLHCLVERAAEEQILIRREMASTLKWHRHQHDLLQEAVLSASGGELSCLVKEGLFLETKLVQLADAFISHVEEVAVPTTFADMVGISLVSTEQSLMLSDLENDIYFIDSMSSDDEEEEDDDESDEDEDDDSLS